MKVSTVEQMRKLDRQASQVYGISEELLMENAGGAAYFVLRERWGVNGRRFAIICGGGNNGGDGFVVARKILSSGGAPRVILLADRDKYRGAAGMNLEILDRSGVETVRLDSPDQLESELASADVIVDALFGTGLDREVRGLHAEAIRRINQSTKPVLSLDIPSGIQGDTGRVMGVAVEAEVTVTFGLPKLGNLLQPGAAYGGELRVTHISFPPPLRESEDLEVSVNAPPKLPPRDPAGHKKTFGEVLFVAGAASYFGAPYFCALSFLKAGGGYARLAAPGSMVPFIASGGREVVFVPQKETRSGSIALENLEDLCALSSQVDMVVLGPGLSLVEETQEMARALAGRVHCPLLVDGDGITALSRDLDIIKGRSVPTVLTPHPGEMSRITGTSPLDIAQAPVEILKAAASDLDAVIVLKGARTLVGYPDGRVFVNLTGNSALATAGTGDVLAGTVAAMAGLGLGMPEAVCKGVFIHGLAGDLAAEDLGADGVTAGDLLRFLPSALRMEREGLITKRPACTGPEVI
ncbi:MAG: NAD(P)H-hydrate dehydratase [Desulfobacteraceae bacterium]